MKELLMWAVISLSFALLALVINGAVKSVIKNGGVDLDLNYKIKVGCKKEDENR